MIGPSAEVEDIWQNDTTGAPVRCAPGAWDEVDLGCIDTYTVDSQVFASMATSGFCGLLCLAAFCVLQPFISVYRGRLLSPQVAIKPPVYTGSGIAKYFYWAWATLSMKEKELLATAGMDALVFERLIVFGLQMMAPVTIISCATLLPIHASSNYLAESAQLISSSNLMVLTMSNMYPKSHVLWVHLGLTWLYCLYAMWLLDRHYKWYVLLRQQYMTRGDSISTWLGQAGPQQIHGLRSKSVLAPESPTRHLLLHPNWGFAKCRPSEADHDAVDDAAQPVELESQKHPLAEGARSPFAAEAAAAVLEPPNGQHLQEPGSAAGEAGIPAAAAANAASSATVSPANSCLTSRQSSGRALLSANGLVKSSSQHIGDTVVELVTVPGAHTSKAAARQRASSWGVFSSKSKNKADTAVTSAAEHGHSSSTHDVSLITCGTAPEGLAEFVSAAGHIPASARSTRSSTGAPSFLRRWQSGGWQRLSRRGSGVDGMAPEQGQAELRDWQEQQLQQKQQAADEAAGAAAAAEKLGADVDWWAFKTGDPLLDRHVVQVDVAADLAWDVAGPEPERLQRWWELAPAEAGSSMPGSAAGIDVAAAPSSSGIATAPCELGVRHRSARSTVDESPSVSNIAPVPGTRLLFDRRSLLARKPSVRFRNTVHVQGANGTVLPLHVSNYAVLVTDVPGGDGSSESDDEDESNPSRSSPNPLLTLLQALIWNWPCLLRQADLTDLGWASSWNTQSFKASNRHKAITCSHSMRQLIQQHQQQELQDATEHAGLQPVQEHIPTRQQRPAGSTGHVRKQQISDRQRLVEQTFKQLFPDDLHTVIPVRNFQAVDELLRQWNTNLQAYIQSRALLQLRLNKLAQRSAAGSRAGAGDVQQHLQQEQQRDRSFSTDAADIEAARLPCQRAARATSDIAAGQASSNGCSPVKRPTGLSIRTEPLPTAAGEASQPARAGGVQLSVAGAHSSAPELWLKQHSSSEAAGADEPCRTPRLPPLKPRPVMPDKVMVQPRLVSKEEEEGTTALGRCCAAIAGSICGGLEDKTEDPAEKEDTVDAVAARLEEQRQALVDLEASILEAQKEVLSSTDTGAFIVLFKTPTASTLAAHSSVFPQSANSLEAFKVQPAPSPEDVLWQSLWKPPAVRQDESVRCLFWYALYYLVPTGIFTAALNSISYSVCNSPNLQSSMAWFCDTRFLQFLFTVVLPMVLVMVWQNGVIPANLYKLEIRRAAAVSLSGMERNILLKYVGWELCNLFLGGVLGASLVSQIKMLADHPGEWALLLGAAFPNSSNFFLNYVIARAFMMNLFRLIMPHGGMWRWIGQMLFSGFASFKHAATERYRAFIIYPASIRYGREPGLILLILLLGVAYSVAAPLMTPFVLAYMCTAYLVWRYQMIYVCIRAYESGGKMWPVYFVIVLWIMGLFVVFTACIFLFKNANLQGILVIPILPMLYMFARYCDYNYSSRVEHPPLWLAHEAPRTEIDPLVYTPTCLQPHAQGWYFEMGKAWVRWGVPAYMDPAL